MNKETIIISKKEYELLKKHQKEYGILLDVLANQEEFLEIMMNSYFHNPNSHLGHSFITQNINFLKTIEIAFKSEFKMKEENKTNARINS